jgi:hypothetical protein
LNKRAHQHFRIHHNRLGLTLLELVIATSLAVLATAAIVGVLGLLEKQRKQTLPTGADAWRTGLIELIERDLMGARQIKFQHGELTMLGHALDDAFEVHVPSETRFVLVRPSNASSGFFMRSMRRLGTLESERNTLICGKILSLQVERIDDRGEHQPISSEYSPSPRRLSIRIQFEGVRGSVYSEHCLFVAH